MSTISINVSITNRNVKSTQNFHQKQFLVINVDNISVMVYCKEQLETIRLLLLISLFIRLLVFWDTLIYLTINYPNNIVNQYTSRTEITAMI